jgi:hypothetical protein
MDTSDNQAYEHRAHAKHLGENVLLGALAEQPSHFGDIFVAELSLVGRGKSEPKPDRVLHVVGLGGPLKVIDGIIGFDCVDVVDLGEVVRVWDERHRHQTVDQMSARPSSGAHGHGEIFFGSLSIPGFSRLDNLRLASEKTSILVECGSVNAADAPDAADLVELAVSSDGNGSPFFNDAGIHVAGFLSGDDGLKIKDPLYASTFGGSAIMASGSDTYNRSIQCR